MYEGLTSNLLKWIDEKIQELSNRQFQNSLEGVKKQLNQFNLYRIKDKELKFTEKGNYFNLNKKNNPKMTYYTVTAKHFWLYKLKIELEFDIRIFKCSNPCFPINNFFKQFDILYANMSQKIIFCIILIVFTIKMQYIVIHSSAYIF